jgi:hypothetical protein
MIGRKAKYGDESLAAARVLGRESAPAALTKSGERPDRSTVTSNEPIRSSTTMNATIVMELAPERMLTGISRRCISLPPKYNGMLAGFA